MKSAVYFLLLTQYRQINTFILLGKRPKTFPKPGPATVLSKQEEIELEDWVKSMARRGLGLTREQVQSVAQRGKEPPGANCKSAALSTPQICLQEL